MTERQTDRHTGTETERQRETERGDLFTKTLTKLIKMNST